MSPRFQKFRGRFKTTREDRKLWPKIQIVSRTLGVPTEIRNRNGTIEKFRRKIEFAGEHLRRPRKIQIAGWRANISGEDLNCHGNI
jgi:hypothetical protein